MLRSVTHVIVIVIAISHPRGTHLSTNRTAASTGQKGLKCDTNCLLTIAFILQTIFFADLL